MYMLGFNASVDLWVGFHMLLGRSHCEIITFDVLRCFEVRMWIYVFIFFLNNPLVVFCRTWGQFTVRDDI